MNTGELLRETLRSLEDQANGLDPARVIAGAKRRRVRRIAVTATASATVAATVIGAFAIYSSPGSPPVASIPATAMPSATVPPHPDDVVADGIRYRARYPGERLAAARIGRNAIEFTATLTEASMFRPLCRSASSHYLAITVNGRDIGNQRFKRSQDCHPGRIAGPSEDRAFTAYDSLLLLPPSDLYGRPVRIRAFLIDQGGRPVSAARDAQVALGVYDREGMRPVSRHYRIPVLREFQGVTYRLADVRTVERLKGRSVELATPAGVPFLVSFGTDVITSAGAGVVLTGLDKRHGWQGPGTTTVPQPARAAATVTATSEGGPHPSKVAGAGVVVLALYVRA